VLTGRGGGNLDSAGSLPTLGPSFPASPVTAAGQHPFPKVLGAAKDATPPDIGDALDTAAGQHRSPKAFKTPKGAAPPDRGGLHLDFRSEDIENTNDARGDHGCGLSGAQATAHKAVPKPTNKEDGVTATTFIYLLDHLFVFCLCLPPAPFCSCPLSPPHPPKPSPSNSQQNA